MAAGRTRGIRPIGSKALNVARIEAGFLMPNIDFVSAEHTVHIGRARSPLELGLGWLVDFKKGHFTGRRALLAEERRGARRRLVGLDIEGNKPAHNCAACMRIAMRTREVGSVTSAIWSPTCKRNIALAMLDAPHFERGASVWAEIYLNRELLWERRMARARVVDEAVLCTRAAPPDAAGRLLSGRPCCARITQRVQPNSALRAPLARSEPRNRKSSSRASARAMTAASPSTTSVCKIFKGEMFALVGSSGCGKTTLLRMLAGFTRQSSGRITHR